MKPIYPTICLLIALFGCHHDHDEHQQEMEEAAQVHKKIIDQEQKVKTLFNDLSSECKKMSEESSWCDSLDVINNDFLAWEESLVEVPGYEDEHDHDHDHDHDHSQPVEVTAEEMLSIQEQLKKEIDNLLLRLNKLNSNIK